MPITKSSKSNETPMEDATRGHLRPAASSSDKSVRLRVMSGTESKIYTLTDEQLEQFQRDGYVVFKSAFSKDVAKLCEKEILEMLRQENSVDVEAPVKARFLLKRRASAVFDRMITPKLASGLDRLFGADGWDRKHFATHGDFFITFPGFVNTSSKPLQLVGRWHVDLGFRVVQAHDVHDRNCAFVPAFLITDSKLDGGCTLVAAGSHKIVARLLGSARQPILRQEMVAFCEGYVSQRAGRDTIVQLVGEAGDVVIMHPLLMHAASANGRDNIRIMGNTGIGGIGKRRIDASDADRSIADEIIWQEIKSIPHRMHNEYLLKLFLLLNRYFWTLRYRLRDKWKTKGELKGVDKLSFRDWGALPHLLLGPVCTAMTSAIFRVIGC